MRCFGEIFASHLLLVAFLSVGTTSALSQPPRANSSPLVSRTEILKDFLSGVIVTATVANSPDAALAFENKISNKYDDRPKQRGSKPKDLGVSMRTDLLGDDHMGLKHCGQAPNCFVSTDNVDDDPDHAIPAWLWPHDSLDKQMAFIELISVIESYPPGQSDVDGGGFKIITCDPKAWYVYVQFESLKNGYIDDVEFAYIDGHGEKNAVQVRSSSRLGYLDFGVNAKRLNYIAKVLREKGWVAPGVDYKTHQNYAIQNNQA